MFLNQLPLEEDVGIGWNIIGHYTVDCEIEFRGQLKGQSSAAPPLLLKLVCLLLVVRELEHLVETHRAY